MTEVLVIGAGLAGLTAAAVLQAGGASVRLIEASARIGGRIDALRHPATGQPFADLGPTWVWPRYQPVAERWLGRLGVATFAQFDSGDAVLDGFGPAPRRQPLPGQDGIARLAGGPAALTDALLREVGADRLGANAAVAGVTAGQGADLAVQLREGAELYSARVILAVPLRLAADLVRPWAGAPLLAALRAAPTWMSTQAKAVALYDRPFWRGQGLSGRIASRLGPLTEVHDHTAATGEAALFGFVGWPAEQRRADPDGLRAAVLQQLARCLGREAGDPARLVIHDWALNPHACSPLDLASPAHHPEVGPDILRTGHLNARLWFAASESALVSPGLIEGAFEAGERAALAVLHSLRR